MIHHDTSSFSPPSSHQRYPIFKKGVHLEPFLRPTRFLKIPLKCWRLVGIGDGALLGIWNPRSSGTWGTTGCSWTTACELQPSALVYLKCHAEEWSSKLLWNELALRLDRSRCHLWYFMIRCGRLHDSQHHSASSQRIGSIRTACACAFGLMGCSQSSRPEFQRRRAENKWMIHWCLSML